MFAGCGEDTGGGKSSAGRVAVVDLNKILEDIGYKSKIEEASQIRTQNLRLRVQVESRNVQAKVVSLAKEIGDRPKAVKPAEPTEDETKAITEWAGKMQNLERARINAGNQLRQAYNQRRQADQNAIRAELAEIRKRIKPLAQRIAREKGLDIVLSASAVVLAHDDGVDITDAVFKEVNELLKAGNFPTIKIPEPVKVVRQPPPTTGPAPKTGVGTDTAPKGGATKTP
jgi:Skp family chaperone for outer membrane proteins